MKKCEQCASEFVPRRGHARFCSTKCRVAWNRENPKTGSTLMTKTDRRELMQVIRQRERVTYTDIDAMAGQRLHEVEQELSALYKPSDDPVWKKAHSAADEAVTEARAKIAAQCDELGIPPNFAPDLGLRWWHRGENASRVRRSELRALAKARIESGVRQAKAAVKRMSVEQQEAIMAGALESSAAMEFLTSLPTPQEFLPAMTVAELEREPPRRNLLEGTADLDAEPDA